MREERLPEDEILLLEQVIRDDEIQAVDELGEELYDDKIDE